MQFRDLLLAVLGGPQVLVTVVATPPEAKALLAARSYDAVVMTNFGVSPWEAAAVVPENHPYPAFFMSGVWDAQLEAACRTRRLQCVRAPFDPGGFRDTVYRQIGRTP